MPDSYATVQGDTWDMISFKLFGAGAENRCSRLIKANSQYAETVFFPAGTKIIVPEDAQPEPTVFYGLAPWKQ